MEKGSEGRCTEPRNVRARFKRQDTSGWVMGRGADCEVRPVTCCLGPPRARVMKDSVNSWELREVSVVAGSGDLCY